MKSASRRHREAMELADQAYLARLHGECDKSLALLRKAFEKEREAACLVANDFTNEPTRSVLHRSAASLALDCGELREAEQLVSLALAGNPPEEIANELRDLMEKVFFAHHLSLRGIELLANEFQFSMWGELVGSGIAPTGEFIGRVRTIETLIYRTAERKREKPYREAGRRKKELEEELDLYITVPRAASFAVSFRLGTQMEFAGMGFGEEVIDEILDCCDLLDRQEIEVLQERIPDPSYYANFVGLVKKLVPDGKTIENVGFTAMRGGKEKHVVFSTPREKVVRALRAPEVVTVASKEELEAGEEVHLQGWLRFADARKPDGLIEIIDDNNVGHKLHIPAGMMADIVRPMFGSEVMVDGRRKGEAIVLEDIQDVSK